MPTQTKTKVSMRSEFISFGVWKKGRMHYAVVRKHELALADIRNRI